MVKVSQMRQKGCDLMVDVNKLKGKIVEKGLSIDKLSRLINVDRATIYRKINNNGETFSIKEADLIVKTLELDAEEAQAIFFSQFVS